MNPQKQCRPRNHSPQIPPETWAAGRAERLLSRGWTAVESQRRLVIHLALCIAALATPGPSPTARGLTTESLASMIRSRWKWRGPNVAIPARPDVVRWEDVGEFQGYRLQRHRLLRCYRLLDPGNVRLGWGSREGCEELLARALGAAPESVRRPNLNVRTFGGLQFWGDERVYCGWRIQRNAIYGHCRLLDPGNVRRAWGSYEQCETAFQRLVDKSVVRPVSDECVILLHGLFRARGSFGDLATFLHRNGYEVVSVKYPSTRATIEEQAARLARVIERLDGARRIHFVTHSLGGPVVRCYLRDHRDPRIGRLVMIAPPNQGARLAAMLSDWPTYDLLTGPVGEELPADRENGIASLPVPWCEFGVIAGGRGDDRGYLPLLPGDDDGVVAVEETRLAGMRDFLVVPAIHTFLMNQPAVSRAVVNFLQTGRFSAATTPATGPPLREAAGEGVQETP